MKFGCGSEIFLIDSFLFFSFIFFFFNTYQKSEFLVSQSVCLSICLPFLPLLFLSIFLLILIGNIRIDHQRTGFDLFITDRPIILTHTRKHAHTYTHT